MLAGIFPDLSTGANPGMALARASGHIPSMELSSKVRELMAARGLNPYSTAAKAGLQEDTVRDILRGKTKDPGASKILKLARALETSVEVLMDDAPQFSGQHAEEIELPVAYVCAAGVWKEVDELAQAAPRMEPAAYIPAYAGWRQWLEEIEGDSIDKLIPPGALIHVVDTQQMGYEPTSGDLVVVERSRAGGFIRERTVKQVEFNAGQIELWPRSHNAKYQQPLKLDHGTEGDDSVEIRIVGKVLQAYMRFTRR